MRFRRTLFSPPILTCGRLLAALLALGSYLVQPAPAEAAPAGQLIVDPAQARWLQYRQGGSFFMCAPGEPEDFLYRGSRRSNGTRSGDQSSLIAKLKSTGANGIYLIAVRSHGGDGNSTHNPFINNDPSKGLNQAVLNQWDNWFTEMDAAGITVFFFFYDDMARIWGSKGDFRTGNERSFVTEIVNRFENHRRLIWVVAEEYSEKWTKQEVSQLAGFIRAADDNNHPIAVHQLNGITFDFPNDPNIDQFAMQFDETNSNALHNALVGAWNDAQGRYNLNLAESHDWGTGKRSRRNSWAAAMAGAYVMHIDWDIANTPNSRLRECGYLRMFMESTTFRDMAPRDDLGFGSTRYLMASPGSAYIAYTEEDGPLGIRSLPAGSATLRWMDTVTGKVVEQTRTFAAADASLTRPAAIGREAALYLRFAPAQPLLIDEFQNSSLPTNWTFERGFWTESAGSLRGTPDSEVGVKIKSRAMADGAFAGCHLCSVETRLEASGGFGDPSEVHVRLLAWYQDKSSNVAVTLKPAQDKVVFRHKQDKITVSRRSIDRVLREDVVYDVAVRFDGTSFLVFLDGALILSEPSAAAGIPFGSVGFQSRNADLAVDRVSASY